MENISKEIVLGKAIDDCYREMFAKAQPMADYDNLLEEYKQGKIDEDKDGPVYNRHYLSKDEYCYILEKYLDAYRLRSEWKDNVEYVERYLNEGGIKDKYIDAYTDERGNYHSGYRGYENVPPLKDHINKIISNECDSDITIVNEITNKVVDKVMELISTCKNFYHFDIDELKFRNTMALGASPTSNKETVKKWWKDHYDIDIEIIDKNPLLLWEYDNYGDEMDEIMTEEYGKDWEKIWWDKYKEEQEQKRKEVEERLKALREENE